MTVRVKICGITNAADALLAVEAGADALGFVFAPSPRRVSVEEAAAIVGALPPFVAAVGVFVNERPARIREIVARCGGGSASSSSPPTRPCSSAGWRPTPARCPGWAGSTAP